MSRISFISGFSGPTRQLMENSSNMQKTMEKISTGKKILKPSDSPAELTRLFSFHNETARLDQYQRNINSAKSELEASEATLGQVNDLLQSVRELAIQSANDTLTADDRRLVADEINERLEELVDLSNTRFADKFLFGGAETQSLDKLVSTTRDDQGRIVDTQYNGDINAKTKAIGDNQHIASNLLVNQIFQANNRQVAGGFQFDPETDLEIPMSETGLAKTKGNFLINDTRIYYDTETDSIVDLAQQINDRQLQVEAVFVDADGREFTPEQATTIDPENISGNLRFALQSRRPQEFYIRDFDRRPDNGETIDGLLHELEILGENGSQPELKERQNYPLTLHENSSTEGQNMFDVLIDLRDSLLGNPPPDVENTQEGIQQAIEDLRLGLDNIMVHRSIGGARLNRLETAANRVEDRELSTKELISKLEDTNFAEAISEYERQRIVQEASLRLTSNIMHLSLVNFL